MPLVHGTLTDIGLNPIPGIATRLRFTPSQPAFDGAALYSAKPVEAEPDAAGGFEVDLLATVPLSQAVHIDVDVVYRDTETHMEHTERVPWWLHVPEAGGPIGELLQFPGDAAKVYIGTEAPASGVKYQWWLNPDTGDLYEWS